MAELVRKEYTPKEWETVNCMFCNSDNYKFYENYGDKLQYTHVLCKNCKLVYQSPRPKYNDDFIQAAYGEYFELDTNYSHKDNIAPTTKLYKLWKDELNEILTFDRNKTAILDVGCGIGKFLYVAKEEFDNCMGVEMSKKMAQLTEEKLGIKVLVEQFDTLTIDNKFSTIHLSHVIEHVPNPKDWLAKCKELLTPEGIVVIAVPNMFSLSRRFKLFLKKIGIFKGRWKENWRTPDHLFEPTPKALKKFIQNNGFEILSFYTYSRKDNTSEKFIHKLMYRKFMLGSNIRTYIRPNTSM